MTNKARRRDAGPEEGGGRGSLRPVKEGAELTKETLLAAIRDRIAHFKLPKKIIFVDEFPRNSVGKILKKELKGQML